MGLILLTLRKKQLLPRRPGQELPSYGNKHPGAAKPREPTQTHRDNAGGEGAPAEGPREPWWRNEANQGAGGWRSSNTAQLLPSSAPHEQQHGEGEQKLTKRSLWALGRGCSGRAVHCSGKAALRAETWRAETRWPQEGALFLIKNKGRRQPGKAGCHLPCSTAWGKVSLLLSPVADGPADAPRCAELGAARARLCCLGLGDTGCAWAAASPSPTPHNDTLLTEVLGRGCNASPAKDRAGLSQTVGAADTEAIQERCHSRDLDEENPSPSKHLPAAGSCKGPAGRSLVLPAANCKMHLCPQTRAERCFPFPCSFEAKLWVTAEDCSTPGKSCSIAAPHGQCGEGHGALAWGSSCQRFSHGDQCKLVLLTVRTRAPEPHTACSCFAPHHEQHPNTPGSLAP